jgi:peptidylprolyl isomerase/peptidyl-prolyl cis-trans isomerase C
MPEAHPYLMLKLSQELFKKTPDALNDGERRRVSTVASRQAQIEQRILATDEAMRVMLPDDSLARSVAEIRNRYPNEEDFLADLERHRLSQSDLHDALRRELTVDAVLERIASRSAKISDTDIEIFYLTNNERFHRPETRRLSQILVTVNEELAGSERPAALAKIETIRARLLKSPERFAEQALKHSECPTAMNGGSLGELPRGKLFDELEPVAFALALDELSEVTESPLGFHLLRCDAINPERVLPLREVRERIRTHLEGSRRNICQKAWIGKLFSKAG